MTPLHSDVPRLQLVDPATAAEPVADALQMISPINQFRAMANAEGIFPSYMNYLNLLFKPMELDRRLVRMIVLHVAKRSDCFYAWRQNVVVARSVGVTLEQVDALEIGDYAAAAFTDAQRAVFRFADEVVQLIEASDTSYDEVRRHFSDRAITEMLYVIGTYMFIVRLARTGRVPLDDKPAEAPHSVVSIRANSHNPVRNLSGQQAISAPLSTPLRFGWTRSQQEILGTCRSHQILERSAVSRKPTSPICHPR